MSLLFWAIAIALIGGVLYVTVQGLITKSKIRDHLDKEGRDKGKQLYAKIKDVQSNTVTEDMIDRWGDKTGEVEYSSLDGVSTYIKVGDCL